MDATHNPQSTIHNPQSLQLLCIKEISKCFKEKNNSEIKKAMNSLHLPNLLKNELKASSIEKESTTWLKDFPIDKIFIFYFISEYRDVHNFYIEKKDKSEAKELLNAYIKNHGKIKNDDDFNNLTKIFRDNGIKNYVWIDKRIGISTNSDVLNKDIVSLPNTELSSSSPIKEYLGKNLCVIL